MPTRDIRTRLVLDGEREFNQAMQEIEREARILTSEMGKLEAQYGLTGDAQDYYSGKSDLLTRQIEQQEIKVRALEEAVEDAAKKYGDSAKQTDGYRIKLNNAEKALINMRKAQKDNEEAMKEYEEATREASDALEDSAQSGDAASGKMKSAFSAFSAAASGDIGELIDAINEMSEAMGESAEGIDADALAIDGAMAGVAAAAAAVVATIIKIGEEMSEQRRTIEREAVAMEIALGLTTEESERLTEAGQRLYIDGFAESLEQAIKDISLTKAYMRDLDDQSLEDITRQAEVLAATTDADTQSILQAAAVMRQEFGTSAQETMDLLAAAMQKNPFAAGEMLDAVREYSVQFQQMGFSAQEMAGLYATALENNIWSLDKLGDAFKELNIRAKDNSDGTRVALQELGLDAERSMTQIAAGGDRARETIKQILEKLGSMPNALKQNELGVALMGSQWEDVGAKAILASLEAEGAWDKATGLIEKNVEKYADATTTANERYYRAMEVASGETLTGIHKVIDTFLTIPRVTRGPLMELFVEVGDDAEKAGEDIGRNVIDGATAGMRNQEQELVSESQNIFQKMFNGIKDFLGIHSPSRLYEQIGQYSGEGYIQGLEKQLADAERNINMALTPAFEAKTAPAARAGNVYNDHSQIVMKVDDVETFVEIKRRLETERVNKRMGYTGR